MQTVFNLKEFKPVNLYKGNSLNREIYNTITEPCYVDINLGNVEYKKSLFLNTQSGYKVLYNKNVADDMSSPSLGYSSAYTFSSFALTNPDDGIEMGLLTGEKLVTKVYKEKIDPDLYKVRVINESDCIKYQFSIPDSSNYTTLFKQQPHPDCCGVNIMNGFTFERNEYSRYRKLAEKLFPLLMVRRAPKLIHLASHQTHAMKLVENAGAVKLSSYINPNSSYTINVYHYDGMNCVKQFERYG